MFQPAAYTALPYRRDIQGIRALGALIIMIFHIWVGKVSGGVDIFIFISGYLMTGIHLRLLRTHGLRGPVHLFSGVLKRITPTAVLILSVAAVLTARSEEHTSELQSRGHLVCRRLLEKKKAGHR